MAVAAGAKHSCALNRHRLAQCWGDNVHRQTDLPRHLSHPAVVFSLMLRMTMETYRASLSRHEEAFRTAIARAVSVADQNVTITGLQCNWTDKVTTTVRIVSNTTECETSNGTNATNRSRVDGWFVWSVQNRSITECRHVVEREYDDAWARLCNAIVLQARVRASDEDSAHAIAARVTTENIAEQIQTVAAFQDMEQFPGVRVWGQATFSGMPVRQYCHVGDYVNRSVAWNVSESYQKLVQQAYDNKDGIKGKEMLDLIKQMQEDIKEGSHVEERCCRWWDPRLNNFPYDIYLNDSTDPYSKNASNTWYFTRVKGDYADATGRRYDGGVCEDRGLPAGDPVAKAECYQPKKRLGVQLGWTRRKTVAYAFDPEDQTRNISATPECPIPRSHCANNLLLDKGLERDKPYFRFDGKFVCTVLQLSAGAHHTCLIYGDENCTNCNTGYTECHGWNDYNQSDVTQCSDGSDPERIKIVDDADVLVCQDGRHPLLYRQVSAGLFHSCGITRGMEKRAMQLAAVDGKMMCWGDNRSGQLGQYVAGARAYPEDKFYDHVSAGAYHTCAVERGTGHVECWGLNEHGQAQGWSELLQSGKVDEGGRFTSVSCGASHTCGTYLPPGNTLLGTEDDGQKIICWGADFAGQVTVPDDLSRGKGNRLVAGVSVGWEHSCAISLHGHQVSCWGNAQPKPGLGDASGQAFDTARPLINKQCIGICSMCSYESKAWRARPSLLVLAYVLVMTALRL